MPFGRLVPSAGVRMPTPFAPVRFAGALAAAGFVVPFVVAIVRFRSLVRSLRVGFRADRLRDTTETVSAIRAVSA